MTSAGDPLALMCIYWYLALACLGLLRGLIEMRKMK